jgi:hypothetical protein
MKLRRRMIPAAILFLTSFTSAAFADTLLFGGKNHDTFLGCLDCNKFDTDSICNKFGKGSAFNSDSIFNSFGNFGSSFSSSSPWNKFSSDESVPVLVDKSGSFYGYFTINSFRSDAVSFSKNLSSIYENSKGDLEVVQNFICN